MGSQKKERVPLRVGQVRDVASATDRKKGIRRPAVIVACEPGVNATEVGAARIAMLDGSRERDKWVYDLLRCPVLAESVAEWLYATGKAIVERGGVIHGTDRFACCGGSDETPPEHTQDCASRTGLNAPQPPPKPGIVPVWPLLIGEIERGNVGRHAALIADDMRERDAAGRAKYGMPLTADNGRDHLVDAYQEALDCAVYLHAAVGVDTPSMAIVDHLMAPALALVHEIRHAIWARYAR